MYRSNIAQYSRYLESRVDDLTILVEKNRTNQTYCGALLWMETARFFLLAMPMNNQLFDNFIHYLNSNLNVLRILSKSNPDQLFYHGAIHEVEKALNEAKKMTA